MIDATELKPGDYIRSYDFEPMPGRTNRYVEGRFTGFDGTYISMTVEKDTCFKAGIRTAITTPLNVFFGEWEGRISVRRTLVEGVEAFKPIRTNPENS